MTDARLRWIKFWPQDWHGNKELRTCSLAARGLWMEMLCIAHDGQPYGHVTLNGKPATVRQIAGIAGVPEREVVKLLAELEEAGVFSRSDVGAIYSRRMVRDMAARVAGQMNGKGGGNPTLTKQDKASHQDGIREGVNPPSNPQEAEAEAEAEKKTGSLRSQRAHEPDGFAEWWRLYPRKDAKDSARRAYTKALKRTTPADLMMALRMYPFAAEPQFIPYPATWLNSGRWENAHETEAIQRTAAPAREGRGDWINDMLRGIT